MTVITIAKPPVNDLETLRRVIETACSPEEPAGLLHRFAGQSDDGSLRVVAEWESREHALAFMADKLGPAVAQVLAPEPAGAPEVTWVELADRYSRQA